MSSLSKQNFSVASALFLGVKLKENQRNKPKSFVLAGMTSGKEDEMMSKKNKPQT